MCSDVDSRICSRLEGVSLNVESLRKAIAEIRPESVIHGLTEESLLRLVLSPVGDVKA